MRKNVGDMRLTLPQGVVGPFFNDDFGDTFGIIYAFTADGFTFRELRDYVEDARSRLLQVKDVSKIEVLGAQDEQVFIEFSTEKLAGLRLDYATIVATLQAQNLVRPAGVIQTAQERVFLRVTGAFESERDIENVNFVAGDRIVRLGDIATVRRGFVDPPQPMFRVNGKPAIGLAIAMRDAGDILALGENIRTEMADVKAALPIGIEPVLVADQAVSVDVAIGDFMTSLWQAIVIILACSFVSLGVRPGTVVALAIPLTLAIVFAVMDGAHIGLHRISLGALIIALTLLVDDAMTTVDAMIRRLGAGDSKDEAATFAYRTLAAPMLIGTLVTISSFVPIGFAQSSAGEYTFSIFAVVAISLIVSWLVAVLFAPLIGKALLRPPKAGAVEKPSRVLAAYAAFLGAAIRAKWATIGLTVAAFAAALVLAQHVPRQFFPASDRSRADRRPDAAPERLDLRHRGRGEAARVGAERRSRRRPLQHLRGARGDPLHPDVQRAAREPVLRAVRDRRQGLRRARAPAEEARDRARRAVPGGRVAGVAARARAAGRLAAAVPDHRARQGRGAPARARVRAATRVSDTRTRHVHYDWMEPARQVRVKVDQDEARRLGVSSRALAAVLNAAVTGSPVTQLRDDIYLVNVVARATESERASFEALSAIQVPTPSGRTVPLRQFATFSEEQEFPLVWRRDRVPTLTVRADVNAGVLPDEVVGALAPKVAEFAAKLPQHYQRRDRRHVRGERSCRAPRCSPSCRS